MFAAHPLQSIEHWLAHEVHAAVKLGQRAGHAAVAPVEGLFKIVRNRLFAEREYEPVWHLGIRDLGNSIVVRFGAAGFAADELDVNVRGSELVFHACRQIPANSKRTDGGELRFQEFYHCEPINFPVDGAKAQSHFSDGILTVTLPKRRPAVERVAIETDRPRSLVPAPRMSRETRQALQAKLPQWPGRHHELAVGSRDPKHVGQQRHGR